MKFTRLSPMDGITHYCDFELEPAYHCGRVARYEATIPTTNPDFEWSEARCELHSVEAFSSSVERTLVEEDGETLPMEKFVAYGWRRRGNGLESGYFVWKGDSRQRDGWKRATDAVDLDDAVELLGSIKQLMGY